MSGPIYRPLPANPECEDCQECETWHPGQCRCCIVAAAEALPQGLDTVKFMEAIQS